MKHVKLYEDYLAESVNEAAIDGDRQKITRAIEDMTKGRLTVGQIQIEIGRAIDQANISSIMKQNLKYAMQIKKESVNEGAMSEIDIMAKEAKNEKDFIKQFLKEYSDKVNDNLETRKWLKSMYSDATN